MSSVVGTKRLKKPGSRRSVPVSTKGSSSSTSKVEKSRGRARAKGTSPRSSLKKGGYTKPRGEAVDKYGFKMTSDAHIVIEFLMAGGASKHEIARKLEERFDGILTRTGFPKPITTIMNQVENTMLSRGYRVESHWRLVPPADGAIGPRPEADGDDEPDAPENTPEIPAGSPESPDPAPAQGKSASSPRKPTKRRVKPRPRTISR